MAYGSLAQPAMALGGLSVTTGMSPGDAAAFATPSLPESAVLGVMLAKHEKGLQSGGLVGFNTLFTGYDPSRGYGGLARRISAGRAAGGAISMTARGLRGLGVQSDILTKLSYADRFGLGGALSAISADQMDDAWAGTRDHAAHKMYERRAAPVRQAAADKIRAAAGITKPDPILRKTVARETRVALDAIDSSVGKKSMTIADRYTNRMMGLGAGRKTMDSRRGLFKFLMGGLGGAGYTDAGKLSMSWSDEIDGFHFATAKEGSKGATMINGQYGRLAGRAIKAGGWMQLIGMGVDIATDFAGSTYSSMVRTANKYSDRYHNNGNIMSPAYMSQAAVTERQRAMMELNSSVLNPRTQLMGNEGYFYHR